MNRTVYVNGDYLPETEAKISVFDRGFIFSDGVYEVSAVLQGRLVDNEGHMRRLGRSLEELRIAWPLPAEEIIEVQKALIEKNALIEGTVYLQVTRGAADRDFAFPGDTPSTLVMFTQERPLIEHPAAKAGIKVISVPDIRWKRRDINSVGLLGPVLAKQAAVDAGVQDAWMVENGYVTEGTSNNAYIVTPEGTLVTRQLSNDILHGITRAAVVALCERDNMVLKERRFTLEEAYAASEAMITSASTFVHPVVEIDGRLIGTGKPGPVATRLRELYIQHALA